MHVRGGRTDRAAGGVIPTFAQEGAHKSEVLCLTLLCYLNLLHDHTYLKGLTFGFFLYS